jgi:hypothetical protein
LAAKVKTKETHSNSPSKIQRSRQSGSFGFVLSLKHALHSVVLAKTAAQPHPRHRSPGSNLGWIADKMKALTIALLCASLLL